MRFLDDFYLTDNIKDDRIKLIRKIKSRKAPVEYFLLTISDIKDGMLDIIPAMELKFWPKEIKDGLQVVGISRGYDKAVELSASIALEVYNEKGNYDLKTYFMEKLK